MQSSASGSSSKAMRGLRLASPSALLVAALAPALLVAQQPTTITGQVTAEDGLAIEFVAVAIESMNLGTLTDREGRYELIIPASRATGQEVTIVASLVGRTSESLMATLSPGTQTTDFVLASDPLQLEEIVVTGVGIEVERAKLGVTINAVEATEILRSSESNIVAALAGKAPNVEVTSSSGDPGAGAYIRIRGANSLIGSNQPLFVIDGLPIDNSTLRIETSGAGTAVANRAQDLNPSDIADLQILKGPAAAAVYGSRAANGVILITTKSGRPGTSNVSYSVNYSNDEVSHLQSLNTAYGQGRGGEAGETSPFSWGPLLGPGATVYDHAGELFQTANTYDQHLTMSGGSDRTTYYLSLGRLDQSGVMRGNSQYDRTTVRLRASHAFRDDLRLDGNFAYTDSYSELVQTGSNISGIQLGALRTPPDFNNLPYLDPDNGLHRSYRNAFPQTVTERRGYDNPFWIANEMPNTASVGRTFGNIGVNYTPTGNITVRYTLGADYSADERSALFPKSSSDFPSGRLIRADLVSLQVDHNLTATLDHSFSSDVAGSITVGQNLNHREYSRYQVNGQTLFLGTDQLDFTVDQSPNEYTETIRTNGYFAQGQLDLWDELFFTGGVRYDGSNTFGTGDSQFAYPKFSTAWDFSDYLGDDLVSFGKLRAAYGVAGKQPPVFSNVNAFQKALITDGWLRPNGLETIYGGAEGVVSEGTLGNQNIEPERITEYEVGTDLAFLDNRLSLGVTYYRQKTTDAILEVDVPPSTGFFSKYANAGEFENEGWELIAGFEAIDRPGFRWSMEGQWATNESCVLDLAGTEEVGLTGFTGSTSSVVAPKKDADGNIIECYPIGALFGDDFIRFGAGNRSDEGYDIDTMFSGWNEGDVYIGDDGYPQYDPRERVTGDPNPDWTASIRNTIQLGDNLIITSLIDFKHGGDMWNGTKGALYYFGAHKDTEPYHGDGATVTFGRSNPGADSNSTLANESVAGPGAGMPVLVDETYFYGNVGSGFTGPASQFIEDAGFVKLRDISISYILENLDFLGRIGLSDAVITVSGRNLKTWTDYTGIDPESNLNGQTLGRGLEYFNNPQTRSFVFGLTLNR